MNEMTYQTNREPIAKNTEHVLKLLSTFEQDETSRLLKERILDREVVGVVKYAQTMDRKDYKDKDWLLECLNECVDGANYAMAGGETELCMHLLGDARYLTKKIDSLIK